MDETFRTLYALNLGYCRRLIQDIEESEMYVQPSPGVNPPAWLLGHLAFCTDYALDLVGQPRRLPESWHEWFGMQSKPVPEPSEQELGPSKEKRLPTKEELWNRHAEGHEAVAEASKTVSAEVLAEPNPLPIEFLVRALPTKGDLLAHLMATHEAAHLGHLSNWRRQTGRPPLF